MIFSGNLTVLAENTAKRAPGKKYCTGSAGAADAGFLAEMKRCSRSAEFLGRTAITAADGTVCTADAGAKGAFHGKTSKTAKKMQQDTKTLLT